MFRIIGSAIIIGLLANNLLVIEIPFLEIITEIVIIGLLFVVGITLGSNRNNIAMIKQTKASVLLVPFLIIGGSFMGGILAGVISNTSFYESLAVTSGLGFYSVSSAILAQKGETVLATITFLSSSMREIIGITFVSYFARIHRIAPVAVVGASSMDVALPVIIKATSSEVGIISLVSGLVITILVPFFTSTFASFV